MLIARAQKKVNGTDKEKVTKAIEYEAARPDHQYESEQVAVRKLYHEICKKQTYNVNLSEFNQVTGRQNSVKVRNFLGTIKTI